MLSPLTCLLVTLLTVTLARPRRSNSVESDYITDDTTKYLMRYGYLPMSDIETGNLRTEEQLRDAIKRLQRYGRIAVTGVVDEATKSIMQQPRCSLPDVPPESTGVYMYAHTRYPFRVRRFVKQGNRWNKLNLTWGIRTYPKNIRDRTGKLDHMTAWEVQREFRLATAVWERPSRLNFIEIEEDVDNADIIIDFRSGYHGDGYPFDGRGKTLAHAFYPGPNIGGDMHFDTDEEWIQHKDTNDSKHGVNKHWDRYRPSNRPSLPPPPAPPNPPSSTVSPTTPHKPRGGDTQEKPDTCDTSYDAISVIRREIYIFKDRYFWRVDPKAGLKPNYPVEITRFWTCLPANLSHVDAVYERPSDASIVFFLGNKYFVCEGNNRLVETGPLKRLGLDNDLEEIDAVFVWGHNGKTYFFSKTMYWRYDERVKHVELDYPRDMGLWRGIPYNIDSAFKFNGTTYFFKDKLFWEFDDLRMKARKKSPLPSAPYWMGCPNDMGTVLGGVSTSHISEGLKHLPSIWMTLVVMILFVDIHVLC